MSVLQDGPTGEDVDGNSTKGTLKSYDAVVFEILKVSPEDFAVSTFNNFTSELKNTILKSSKVLSVAVKVAL